MIIHLRRHYLLFPIYGIGMAVSLYLWYFGTNNIPGCLSGSGCNTVANSEYSHFLGIPFAVWGAVYYFIGFVLAFFRSYFPKHIVPKITIWNHTIAGVIVTFYLTYLELFKIHAWCSWCKVSTLMVILMVIFSVQDVRKSGNMKQLKEQLLEANKVL